MLGTTIERPARNCSTNIEKNYPIAKIGYENMRLPFFQT
jgi:hypothetical protein